MKTKELKINQAVVVKAIGVSELKDNEQVLVGVKAIFHKGKFIPTTQAFKLTKNIFDYCEEGELVIIKREK